MNFEKIYKLGGTTEKFDNVCKKYIDNELPSILPPVRRIIAIGDLHGDWEMTIKVLKSAKVIDDNLDWIGHDTVIVQVGDQIDRCRSKKGSCKLKDETYEDEPSDIKILKFMTELHNKAIKKGGAVYSLLGNHEIMNVMGDFRYVSYENLKMFDENIDKAIEKRKKFFKIGNEFSQFLACTRKTALIIGSNIFVHAGINHKLSSKMSVEEMNQIIKNWLLDKINKSNKLNILKNADLSPFWFRLFGTLKSDINDSNNKTCNDLALSLETYNVNRMIVGHTPQSFSGDNGISASCNKKVFRIDTGSSKAFHYYDQHFLKTGKINPKRNLQYLEILDDDKIEIIKIKS